MNDWTIMTWLLGYVCGTLFTSLIWYLAIRSDAEVSEEVIKK